MTYAPKSAILELGPEFYDPVEAADFPKTELRYRDALSAQSIGLGGLTDAEWVTHFGRFEPLDGTLETPLALRYHGHQFQHYNPELGDGRGFLFAQMTDRAGRLMDLGTKGSGTTPYSRRGDGRLTLLGGVREVLATRYLEHLGVNTSKSLSLIETGEALQRHDEASPTRSAVLVRLSHSHIRFGTFQRQAFFQNMDNLEALVDYCIRHFYPEAKGADGLLQAVSEASADMVASWMAAGFVHGVMNTDNMNITGESFDYGPYRFLPTLRPGFTAAYFDHNGLYAFARQPDVMHWNLAQLAQSLSLICDDDVLLAALQSYAPAYRAALRRHMFRRLGVAPGPDMKADLEFITQTFEVLERSQAAWPQFWHDWCGGAGQEERAMKSPNVEVYKDPLFTDWIKAFETYDAVAAPPESDTPVSLLYEEIGDLWDPIAEQDDWSAFEAKLGTFTRTEL